MEAAKAEMDVDSSQSTLSQSLTAQMDNSIDNALNAVKETAAYCTPEQHQQMQDLLMAMQEQQKEMQKKDVELQRKADLTKQEYLQDLQEQSRAGTAAAASAAAAAPAAAASSNKQWPNPLLAMQSGMAKPVPTDGFDVENKAPKTPDILKTNGKERDRSSSAKRHGDGDEGKASGPKQYKAGNNYFEQELEEEIEKRRQLKDNLEDMQDDIKIMKYEMEKCRYTTVRIMEALGREADSESGTLILLIKKKGTTMRELFSKWQEFQEHFADKKEVIQVLSAGPVWTIKTKCTGQVNSMHDKVKSYVADKMNGGMTVFKGKSAITNMKESIVKACWMTTLATLRVPKDDRSHNIKPRWPDQKGEWSICRGEFCFARGKLNVEKLEMEIELNAAGYLIEGVSYVTKMRDDLINANNENRDKCIAVLNVKILDTVREAWGRRPKG